jgi:hypothetical protein
MKTGLGERGPVLSSCPRRTGKPPRKEAGVPKERKAPILLPDYRPEPFKGHFTFFECG